MEGLARPPGRPSRASILLAPRTSRPGSRPARRRAGPSADHVADHEDLGVTRERDVGLDLDPPGPVDLGAGLLGERRARAGWPRRRPPRSWSRTRSGGAIRPCPSPRGRWRPCRRPSRRAGSRRRASRAACSCAATASRPKAGSTAVGGVEQDDPALARCRCGGSRVLSVPVASSAIWPAISTPVGPAPTTTNVSRRLRCLGVALDLGQLERAEDAPAQLEGVVDALHAGGELGEAGRCRSTTARRRRRRSGCRSGVTVSFSGATEVTVCAARSMCGTSPRITRALRCRLRISRVAGAISPADRMPVATW